MKEIFYVIEINAEVTGETSGWKPLSDTEYTKREADKELRRLRRLNSPYKFRKRYLYAEDMEIVTAKNMPPILIQRG